MKKILFVIHTLQVGGAEKILINILRNIDKTKYDVTLLAIVNDGLYIDEVKKIDGININIYLIHFVNSHKVKKRQKFICSKGR